MKRCSPLRRAGMPLRIVALVLAGTVVEASAAPPVKSAQETQRVSGTALPQKRSFLQRLRGKDAEKAPEREVARPVPAPAPQVQKAVKQARKQAPPQPPARKNNSGGASGSSPPPAPPDDPPGERKKGFLSFLKPEPAPEAQPPAESNPPSTRPGKPAPSGPALARKAGTAGPPAALSPENSGHSGEIVPPEKKSLLARLRERLDGKHMEAEPVQKPERPEDLREHFVVTEDSAGFYSFGPVQAGGADLRLNRGAAVKVLSTRRGWAHVKLLESERTGYIGTDLLRQAEDADFQPPDAVATTQIARRAGLPSTTPQPWQPALPPVDLPDIPMAPGTEDGLLLLPLMEGGAGSRASRKEDTENPGAADPPLLTPGQALPDPQDDDQSPATDEAEKPVAPPPPAKDVPDPPAADAEAIPDSEPEPETSPAAVPPSSPPDPAEEPEQTS